LRWTLPIVRIGIHDHAIARFPAPDHIGSEGNKARRSPFGSPWVVRRRMLLRFRAIVPIPVGVSENLANKRHRLVGADPHSVVVDFLPLFWVGRVRSILQKRSNRLKL